MKQIYKFYKDDCPPCKGLAPVWDELKKEFGEKVKFTEVDVGNPTGMQFAIDSGIGSVPTITSSDGFRHSGVITKEEFKNKFLKDEINTDWMGGNGIDWMGTQI